MKATRVNVDIPNTVIVDTAGLSEPVRIIGIYWPHSQKRDLDDILPYVTEGTILMGDFNATVDEWNSPATDQRGAYVKEWTKANNLSYMQSTAHTSKRSLRNIDLSFTNNVVVSSETILLGSSDHWPVLLSCENISFDSTNIFPYTNWKAYETVLVLLETFWKKEQRKKDADEWYKEYICFIAAVKSRLTCWKEKDKFRPSLPNDIVRRLKEIRKVRNKYYHLRKRGIPYKETRVLLRVLTRESKTMIGKYKTDRWHSFLSDIQTAHDNTDRAFWTHLARIYKSRSLPFYKLAAKDKILSTHQEIVDELSQYYNEQFRAPLIDYTQAHDSKIEFEHNELLNELLVTNKQVEKTSTTEINRLIRR